MGGTWQVPVKQSAQTCQEKYFLHEHDKLLYVHQDPKLSTKAHLGTVPAPFLVIHC